MGITAKPCGKLQSIIKKMENKLELQSQKHSFIKIKGTKKESK